MQHVIGHQNVGLIFNRQIAGDSVSHFGVSDLPIGHGTFYLGNKGQDYFAPIYIYNDDLLSGDKSSNVSEGFVRLFASKLPIKITDRFPEHLLGYIYAIFYSKSYRSRYSEYIKLDFPRIPLPKSEKLFTMLSEIGDKIVKIHLLKSTLPDASDIKFSVTPNKSLIESVSWSDDTVWINEDKSVGFSGITKSTWNFEMGGYQVLERWLKTREGHVMRKNDIEHYQKIVVALSETIRLMAEIDKVIDEHGGWPSALQAKP
jgi:predicted helicase